MIKSKPFSASIYPYSKEIRTFLIRDYKYLRTVRQFHGQEDIQTGLIPRFLKKIKRSKTMRKLSLKVEPGLDIHIKPETLQAILKVHSQDLQCLNMSALWCAFSVLHKSPIFNLKNLQTLYLTNKLTDIASLKALRALDFLNIDLRHNGLKPKELFRPLQRLRKLKTISVSPYPTALDDAVQLLNQLSIEINPPIKIEISTKNDRNYSTAPDFHRPLLENLTKVCLHYINTASVLDNLFIKSTAAFPNLKVLKLGFATPDMQLASHLKHIRFMEALEMASLDFTECWSPEFSEGVIRELKLPSSLKILKINMALSLKNLVKADMNLIEQDINQGQGYPWRYYNLFEEEPLFRTFLQMIEDAKNLQTIDFKFYMLERFNSHYTNFFVSMMNRMSNVSSITFHVVKYNLKRHKNEVSGQFDLALFLNECSRLKNLEYVEVYMPNLLFEHAELSPDLKRLKGFNIGTTENDDEAPIKFQNVNGCIRKIMKTLVSIAPDLTSFVLDFAEVMNEKTFLKRFEMIQEFKNLQYLGGRFIIRECRPQTVRIVGRIFQSLRKLDTVVLGFYQSDKTTFEIKNYLNYHKSIRDVLVTFNKTTWTGDSHQNSNEEDHHGLSELGQLESLDSDSIFETMEIDHNGNNE